MTKEYVLGTDQEELNRLNLQHELWKAEAIRLWDLVGFKRGQHLLDLGCGPGFTSLELARRVGTAGSVTAVDVSENFLNHLQARADEPHSGAIHTHLCPVEKLDFSPKQFDGAYCRWLLIFVQNPERALQTVFNQLKDGATFCLQEYISYDSMALAPDEPIMTEVVQAIFRSWRDQGGDPNRGRDLPTLLAKVGFRNISVEPIIKFIHPKDSLWSWPESFYHSFIPRLIQGQYLSKESAAEFFKTWERVSLNPQAFLISPMMINISATK